jgi:hypothetical protein
MCSVLANAESPDSGDMDLLMALGGLIILGATAFLAFLLIFISRRRSHARADLFPALAFYWAIAAAGSLLYAEVSQMNWSKEYNLLLSSGYFDPQDTTGAPRLPWLIWICLAVAYGAMLVWSFSRQRPAPPGR